MTQEPQQTDLFDWKPEEKKPFRLWKSLKSKYFWLVTALVIVLAAVLFNYNSINELLSSDNAKNFYSKYWLFIFGSISIISTFLALWLIPKWQVRTLKNKKGGEDQSEFDLEEKRIKLRDDTRKTMAQIIGGAFFALGLVVSYNTYELNRQTQINERFSKAVTSVSSADAAIRLNGLYTLESIAKDSPKEHTTIMEALAAFIREKSREQKEAYLNTRLNPEEKEFLTKSTPKIVPIDYHPTGLEKKVIDMEKEAEKQRPNQDILAAIEIIKRRNIEQDVKDFVFDLQDVNLNYISLSSAKLNKAKLDRAHLEWADLRNINLSDASLKNAKLNYARLEDANFENARFNEAELIQVSFMNTIVSGANFDFADLRNASLRYSKGLKCEQISLSLIDEYTQLPDYCESQKAKFIERSKAIIERLGLPSLYEE